MPSSRLMPGFAPTAQDARPLAWWTGAQLEGLCGQVTKAWSAWAHDWVGDRPTCTAAAVQAHERPNAERTVWLSLGTRGAAAAWVQVRVDAVADVLETLFAAGPMIGSSGEEGIAQAVASRAWTALSDALCDALALDPDAGRQGPDPLSFKPWSGCVLVSLAGAQRLARTLLLNEACVRAALGPLAASTVTGRSTQKPGSTLVPLAQALAARKLSLRVELSSCELDLGSLESLRIGDVVPLPHSLETPLLVSTLEDAQVCAGFLGRQGAFKAIELAREAPIEREVQIDHHC